MRWRCWPGGSGAGSAVSGSRAQWAGLVGACQSLVNTATAVQDVAITAVAAIEQEWAEDGTTVERVRAGGHVALDAPDVVAGVLGVSHGHAQRRVALAVALVADAEVAGDGDAAGAGVPGGDGASGLSGLHAAMAGGVLDAYRAGVVVEELAGAPPEVAAAVVAVLEEHLGVEAPVQLRRRCRRVLARVCPDLLRQRAVRARAGCGLRRWVQEPGVDRWEGTFASEQAAQGWAVVDALARRYLAQGRCERVEAARGQALMDLVRGQATIDVELVLTVPADVATPPPALPMATPPPALRVATPPPVLRVARPPITPEHAPPLTRGTSSLDDRGAPPRSASDAGLPVAADACPPVVPDARGTAVSSRPGQAGTQRPPAVAGTSPGVPDVVTQGAPQAHLSPEDLVEVVGPFPGEPLLVRRAWLTGLDRAAVVRGARCHASTGALLDDSGRPNARVPPERTTDRRGQDP